MNIQFQFVNHKKKCSSRSEQAPGSNVQITKTVIVKNPEAGFSPDCVGLNPDEMSEKEVSIAYIYNIEWQEVSVDRLSGTVQSRNCNFVEEGDSGEWNRTRQSFGERL